MRYIFNFPDIGEGLEEGTILEWYVVKGQSIKAGQPLVNMETDKIVTDIPSPKAGTIVEIYGAVGETIHVGSPLVEIEIEGVFGADAVAEAKEPITKEPAEVKEPVTKELIEEEEGAGVVGTMELAGKNAYLAASDEGSSKPTTESKPAVKVQATPLARAMAREMNIDINRVIGSGPSGRVTKEDIQNNKGSKQMQPTTQKSDSYTQTFALEEVTYEPLSQIRKAIAKNMLNSKQSTAHMTLFEEVEISELINVREKFKKPFSEKNTKLTYLSFIVKATVLTLKQHRQLNSQIDLENDRMIYKNRYNIGIAVDTPEGLVVPVIKEADSFPYCKLHKKSLNCRKKQGIGNCHWTI